MFDLNKTLIVRTIKLLGKLSGASNETIEWVTHYALGSQEPKKLPESLMEQSQREVYHVLGGQFYGKENYCKVGYYGHSLTGSLNKGCCVEDEWWKDTGASTVGAFNFSVELDYANEKVKVFCRDHWDFNGFKSQLKVKVPQVMEQPITALLHKLEVEDFYFEDGYLSVAERSLAKFNDTHSFWTYWEHEFDFSQFRANLHNFKAKGSYVVRFR